MSVDEKQIGGVLLCPVCGHAFNLITGCVHCAAEMRKMETDALADYLKKRGKAQ